GLPTILVVDDEPEALDVTRQMLAGACQVLTASTSGTGLKAAMTQKPDLILLDAWLPGVSGYDVCQTLKRNVNTRHVPIVIVTAAAQAADEAAAQAAGADGYLTKPFRKADLLRLVGQFVSTPATAPA
ncbi:MAG: response regulator, partial [Anaerolineales bacterium]|nr:response regulator [Anaerolineales bacterium]